MRWGVAWSLTSIGADQITDVDKVALFYYADTTLSLTYVCVCMSAGVCMGSTAQEAKETRRLEQQC